jgi:futalosine hydrolase
MMDGSPASLPLALICSVGLEAEPLQRHVEDALHERIGTKPVTSGILAGRRVLIVTGGMGKTNAAHALTALLETRRVAGVVGFGVGGAYPGSGLSIGDVAVATSEIYGDEGVLTADDWLSTREIGIPLVDRGSEPIFNTIDLDGAVVRRAEEALCSGNLEPETGAFVTVSACSGTLARGQELHARFGALCETMEGAAYAHVCAIYGIPFAEVRGISNLVEDRDLRRWRLQAAADVAADAARMVAGAW